MKEQLARQYKLDYPFKRFSIVEVPVQFASYERAWSQAQETVQPEMVLFPEKGAIFWELDVKRQVKNHIRWSGNNEISLQEAQMRTFSNFAWMFLQTEGDYNFSSGSRGRGNLSSTANPYFLFRRFIISGTIFTLRNGLLPIVLLSYICKRSRKMKGGNVR